MEELLEPSLAPGPTESSEKVDCLLDALLAGAEALGRSSDVKSNLLPARRSVRFGEARARASLRKVGRALNEA